MGHFPISQFTSISENHQNLRQRGIFPSLRRPTPALNPTELGQVFVNLLANAIQASKPGSVVKVSFASSDEGLSVAVEDQGCGVAPSDQEKIFDPFYTTHLHDDAVGLGLSIAYGIVTDHGGAIRVRSQPGEGTCVTVLVPLAGVADRTENSRNP